MTKPVINIADIELQPRPAAFAPSGEAAQRYDARMGFIAPKIGAQKLGYNITAVPPGKCAFPKHNHRVNEEMFFILEGSGELRFGDETYEVKQGDFIACPPGGKNRAHQILNTGEIELKYLAVSTKMTPELVDYPDSDKFGLLAEVPSETGDTPEVIRYVGRFSDCRDYWEDE